VSSIVRDITHRKQIAAALRERNALRYVASLAAAAAHEIQQSAGRRSWATRSCSPRRSTLQGARGSKRSSRPCGGSRGSSIS